MFSVADNEPAVCVKVVGDVVSPHVLRVIEMARSKRTRGAPFIRLSP
jgi:hypothetical protein